MNKLRRAQMQAIKEKLDELKGDLELIRDEEQEYYDNMPESLKYGDKGEAAESNVTNMETAIDSIGTASSDLDTAISDC